MRGVLSSLHRHSQFLRCLGRLFCFRRGRISGIVSGLLKPGALSAPDVFERSSFLVGMVASGAAIAAAFPSALGAPTGDLAAADSLRLAAAGFLVGVGTARGNGCTSGHGISGNARLSPRSMVATLSFMGSGMAAASVFGTAAWRRALSAAAAAAPGSSSLASSTAALAWPPSPAASGLAAAGIALAFGAAVAAVLATTAAAGHHEKLRAAEASAAAAAKPQAGAGVSAVAVGAARAAVTGLAGGAFGLALALAGMAVRAPEAGLVPPPPSLSLLRS